MKPFTPQAQRWLKLFHIFFAGLWLSSSITIALLTSLVSADEGTELLGIHRATKFIDDFVLIPAANGTWVTGLLYSLKTRVGWLKHRWVAIKWAIAISGILIGTFVLGPSLNALPALAGRLGTQALTSRDYRSSVGVLLYVSPLQVTMLLVALCFSVLKPALRGSRTPARSPAAGAGISEVV